MPSTIAHEGNPRQTPDLVVVGTLDGTATLILPGPSPITLPVPSPIQATPTPSAGDKYIFSTDDQGNVTFSFGTATIDTNLPQGTAREQIDPVIFVPFEGWVKEYSKRNSFVRSGFIKQISLRNLERPGSYYKELDFFQFCDLDPDIFDGLLARTQYVQAGLYESVTGFPFSGVAVCVDPESTVQDFTGIVGAYDWFTDTLYLMTYLHQPLSNLGTVLDTTTGVNPQVGDPISIFFTKSNDDNLFTVQVTFGSTTILLESQSEASLPYFDVGVEVALVDIASTSTIVGDDAVTWEDVYTYVTYST
jgi:hypothetical protein